MNYSELRDAILDDAHRDDLTTQVVAFVRRAEGMIARELRAMDMVTQVQLAEADRIAAGAYALPADFLEERIFVSAARRLRKISVAALADYSTSGNVLVFGLRGDAGTYSVDFRAVPATDAIIDLEYFARPAALSDDADTNDLLDRHESLYLHGALFALYSWTQDLELAQGAYDTWRATVDTLNQQTGRHLGGTHATAAYNLGHRAVGRGY